MWRDGRTNWSWQMKTNLSSFCKGLSGSLHRIQTLWCLVVPLLYSFQRLPGVSAAINTTFCVTNSVRPGSWQLDSCRYTSCRNLGTKSITLSDAIHWGRHKLFFYLQISKKQMSKRFVGASNWQLSVVTCKVSILMSHNLLLDQTYI